MGRFDCLHNAGAEEKRRLKTYPSTGAAQYVPFGIAKRAIPAYSRPRPHAAAQPHADTTPTAGPSLTPPTGLFITKNTHKNVAHNDFLFYRIYGGTRRLKG